MKKLFYLADFYIRSAFCFSYVGGLFLIYFLILIFNFLISFFSDLIINSRWSKIIFLLILTGFQVYGEDNFVLLGVDDLNKTIEEMNLFFENLEYSPGEKLGLEILSYYLEELYFSPIDVYLINPDFQDSLFLKENLKRFFSNITYDISSVQGIYFYKPLRKKDSKEFIVLFDRGDFHTIISSYFHELGHYNCRVNDCICKIDRTLSEIHAYEFEIRSLMERGFKDSLYYSIKSIVLMMKDNFDNIYTPTFFLVSQGNVWKDALEYLKGKD